jgi:hypothetical protein
VARSGFVWVSLGLLVFTGVLSVQAPAKVDFARYVLPVFRQNCGGCHGTSRASPSLSKIPPTTKN